MKGRTLSNGSHLAAKNQVPGRRTHPADTVLKAANRSPNRVVGAGPDRFRAQGCWTRRSDLVRFRCTTSLMTFEWTKGRRCPRSSSTYGRRGIEGMDSEDRCVDRITVGEMTLAVRALFRVPHGERPRVIDTRAQCSPPSSADRCGSPS
jgi:hypothetical protein